MFGSIQKKRPEDYYPMDEVRFRELRRKHTVRLFMTYLAPFLILTIYLYVQYQAMDEENRRLRLRAIAETQANTLDLFLSERLINLSNRIDDPRMPIPATDDYLQEAFAKLQKASAAFVDLGCFDDSGKLVAYVGPYPSLTKQSYASEKWFATLKQGRSDFESTIRFERNRLQLGQAAKLASIGELAAGIAHEINNPLAAMVERR